MAKSIKDLPTPCFLVDLERLRTNVAKMSQVCTELNIKLRPNTKTHKTIEIAVMSTGGSKRCIEVSTLIEAETYADAGFDDILYAYPITQDKIDRCIKLLSRLNKFHVMVSDESGVECLKANVDKLPKGKTWSVALELDLGLKRTGFLPKSDEFVSAYRDIITNKHMTLLSLYCFCGHSYRGVEEEEEEDMVNMMIWCKERILKDFPDTDMVLGIGSTPTCSNAMTIHSKMGEFHPGTYVFYDYEQCLLRACTQSDIACRVMTKVVCHKEEQNLLLVDCGYLALGLKGFKERPDDFCVIQGESDLRLIGLNQELGKITTKEGKLDFDKYPVGTTFFIYPYQSNSTAALHSVYYVHSGDEVKDVWKPVRGW